MKEITCHHCKWPYQFKNGKNHACPQCINDKKIMTLFYKYTSITEKKQKKNNYMPK